MRPHVEIFFAKILKIGQLITIFVRFTKIQKQVQKKSRKGVFRPFFKIDTKKSYSIQIFKPGRNIMSLFIRNIQILTKSKIKDTFFSLTPYTQEPKSSKIHFSRHHNVEIPYHILATQRMNLRKFLWKVREIRASLRLKELLSLHHV